MDKKGDRLRIFEGAVAIITGGASGIGRALGEELAARGAHVTLADLQGEFAAGAAADIRAAGGKAESAALDVTGAAAVEILVKETAAKHGRLDFMFNNAGIGIVGDLHNFTLDHWRRVLDVNLMGVIHGVQAAYPVMRAQGFGHIVNTSSMGGLIPFPLNASYTASKFAVYGLSLSNRIDAMDFGVRVSVICPGVINTPILSPNERNAILYDVDPTPEDVEAMWKRYKPADPNKFAKKVLNKVARNKAVIIEPKVWLIPWWLMRLSPALMLKLLKPGFYDIGKAQVAQLEAKTRARRAARAEDQINS
jgi:NAD(P)-dependent dehydrogenase (short-subunit alcohol dehydrogenase family)